MAEENARPEGAAKPGKKNIIVCCDGTGNEFGGCNSNVVKIYTAAAIDNDQVGYYHPGVGTMGAPTAQGKLGMWWSKIKGLAFGYGFMDNVLDAYRYLMTVYDDGDQIYIFGFSRGAYTVRALVALLYSYGLLCKGNDGHIPYIWRMFLNDIAAARDQKKRSVDIHKEFKSTFSHCVNLRFVGMWDTVSSVGWVSTPLRLLYSSQNASIQCGRHAVSIDERRCFYTDNLWGEPLKKTDPRWQDEMKSLAKATKDLKFLEAEQDILQVWFAGVHSDVGGSYPQSESALSNVTLEWMLTEAKAAGLITIPERERMLFGEPAKSAAGPDTRLPEAHLYEAPPTGWKSQAIHKSLYGWWWLLELRYSLHYDNDEKKVERIFPLGRMRTIPDKSVIHPTVVGRIEAKNGYAPGDLLSRGELVPHPGSQEGTNADLRGYFVYQKPPRQGVAK